MGRKTAWLCRSFLPPPKKDKFGNILNVIQHIFGWMCDPRAVAIVVLIIFQWFIDANARSRKGFPSRLYLYMYSARKKEEKWARLHQLSSSSSSLPVIDLQGPTGFFFQLARDKEPKIFREKRKQKTQNKIPYIISEYPFVSFQCAYESPHPLLAHFYTCPLNKKN